MPYRGVNIDERAAPGSRQRRRLLRGRWRHGCAASRRSAHQRAALGASYPHVAYLPSVTLAYLAALRSAWLSRMVSLGDRISYRDRAQRRVLRVRQRGGVAGLLNGIAIVARQTSTISRTASATSKKAKRALITHSVWRRRSGIKA